MSQKKLGLVEMEWVCPNCGNRSPGLEKKCRSCGKPQPQDVEFVQPVDRAIITDAETLAEASRAPDIHCPASSWKRRQRRCARPRRAAAVTSGAGLTPDGWPTLASTVKQRPGARREKYTVVFESDGATYPYVVQDPTQAAQFVPGSRWTLEINTFGALTDVAPAR